jgi:hypothetical protein
MYRERHCSALVKGEEAIDSSTFPYITKFQGLKTSVKIKVGP